MPLAIIAGIPSSLFNRFRKFAPAAEGWDVTIIPSRDPKNADLKKGWAQVTSAADEAGEAGAHIFAFHREGNQRSWFVDELRDRHRLILMDRQLLRLFGTDEFTSTFHELLDFEIRWRAALRPAGVGSPLMLPEPSFSPTGGANMWERVRSLTIWNDNATRVSELLTYFTQLHRRGPVWRDGKELEFDPSGERHAVAPRGRRWKFTYFTPERFHFDVQHARHGTDFTLRDAEGQLRRFRRYTNVDCHGFVRGGR